MSNKLKFLVILFCSFFMSFAFASDSEDENPQEPVPTHLIQIENEEESDDDEDVRLGKAYQQIEDAEIEEDKAAAAEKLDKLLYDLVGNCSSADELMDLGKKIYYDFNDSIKAKDKVLYCLSDHIEDGGFENLDDLCELLSEMGFRSIINEITEINQRGSGRR